MEKSDIGIQPDDKVLIEISLSGHQLIERYKEMIK